MPSKSTRPSTLNEDVPIVPQGTSIPKVIHQVYFPGEVPLEIKENIRKIKALNPTWEYRLYDDRDMVAFLREVYGRRTLEFYDRIDDNYGVAKVDLFKYLLMYKAGGVYLDIKSTLDRPLDEVLRPDDVYLLSRWRNAKGEQHMGWGLHKDLRRYGGEEFQQWHIIAAPGHPFLRAVNSAVEANIGHYNPIFHSTGKGAVIRMSGPIPYTQAIVPLLSQHPHRFVDSRDDLGLIYSIYDSSGGSHTALFKSHYTKLRLPVTKLGAATRLLWTVLGPIQNMVRQLRDALRGLTG